MNKSKALSMPDLNQVREKINKIIKAIREDFQVEELELYMKGIDEAEVLLPFFDFSHWQRLPPDAFSEARKIAKTFLEIKKSKMPGIFKSYKEVS